MLLIGKAIHKVTLIVAFIGVKKMLDESSVRELIQIFIGQGWYLSRQNGTSHRQFKHPTIKRTVTVDGKLSQDVLIDNLKSMERQSGLKFIDLLIKIYCINRMKMLKVIVC